MISTILLISAWSEVLAMALTTRLAGNIRSLGTCSVPTPQCHLWNLKMSPLFRGHTIKGISHWCLFSSKTSFVTSPQLFLIIIPVSVSRVVSQLTPAPRLSLVPENGPYSHCGCCGEPCIPVHTTPVSVVCEAGRRKVWSHWCLVTTIGKACLRVKPTQRKAE